MNETVKWHNVFKKLANFVIMYYEYNFPLMWNKIYACRQLFQTENTRVVKKSNRLIKLH